MTNIEIIVNEAIQNKIYTKEEVIERIKECGELPLHTFQAWKSKGYAVKKGEKATIVTKLWKYKTYTVKNKQGEEEERTKCYLFKAYLFTENQVEEIKKAA